jgi:uncharacterized DUF497 family protein
VSAAADGIDLVHRECGSSLAVAHAEEGDSIRIISARVATRHEKRLYEEG